MRLIEVRKSGAPRAKPRDSSKSFVGRNPPKHTLLRSFGTSKGTLPAFIHGLKTLACAPKCASARRRGFLRRRVMELHWPKNPPLTPPSPLVGGRG